MQDKRPRVPAQPDRNLVCCEIEAAHIVRRLTVRCVSKRETGIPSEWTCHCSARVHSVVTWAGQNLRCRRLAIVRKSEMRISSPYAGKLSRSGHCQLVRSCPDKHAASGRQSVQKTQRNASSRECIVQ